MSFDLEAFDAFYSLVHREKKIFSLFHVPNQDVMSPIKNMAAARRFAESMY